MFLLPGIVITWYVTGTAIPDEFRIEISNYLWSKQRSDGGWGLHIEGDSTVFGTAMNYTVLRLLGQDSEDLRMVKARGLLHEMGGAVNGPHWAKFWLSVLNVCEWDAVNPVPPELWYVQDVPQSAMGLLEADHMSMTGFFPTTYQSLHGDGGYTCVKSSYQCHSSTLLNTNIL